MLSRQVIDKDTSNLAKYYVSIRSVFGGGNSLTEFILVHLRDDAMQQDRRP